MGGPRPPPPPQPASPPSAPVAAGVASAAPSHPPLSSPTPPLAVCDNLTASNGSCSANAVSFISRRPRWACTSATRTRDAGAPTKAAVVPPPRCFRTATARPSDGSAPPASGPAPVPSSHNRPSRGLGLQQGRRCRHRPCRVKAGWHPRGEPPARTRMVADSVATGWPSCGRRGRRRGRASRGVLRPCRRSRPPTWPPWAARGRAAGAQRRGTSTCGGTLAVGVLLWGMGGSVHWRLRCCLWRRRRLGCWWLHVSFWRGCRRTLAVALFVF